ncbi:hypothetical protein QTP86_018787, partial [Hemibagrus guttatus]
FSSLSLEEFEVRTEDRALQLFPVSISSVQCGFFSPSESSFTPESCSLLSLRFSSLSLEEFEVRTEDRALQLSSVRKNQRYMMAEKVTEIEEATERCQALETRSIASASTNRSRSSSASIVAAKARAKLEAARAKAEFLKKESEILIEKAQLKVMEARMDASLSALKHESEVAAALAEAKVLEAAAESDLGERISDVREISDRTLITSCVSLNWSYHHLLETNHTNHL